MCNVSDHLHGVKNGRKIGSLSNIVVKNVVVNEKKQLNLDPLHKKGLQQPQTNYI